jgi:hypothetical protein
MNISHDPVLPQPRVHDLLVFEGDARMRGSRATTRIRVHRRNEIGDRRFETAGRAIGGLPRVCEAEPGGGGVVCTTYAAKSLPRGGEAVLNDRLRRDRRQYTLRQDDDHDAFRLGGSIAAVACRHRSGAGLLWPTFVIEIAPKGQ